ncbi:PHA/PHB synthase family protein [Ideonella livida]|uniref:Poly-beta-hydroxybutyrate polymerase n=1 Tax=Ideonella livida TaxID=2707176 RepID=A0A7C9PJA8_9BURK|nr:alpha/beta fold hydrolase [Ideonella livida]NDY93395.1 poly-beta-hydroxybutyrate polymerase [Ideonella livida]
MTLPTDPTLAALLPDAPASHCTDPELRAREAATRLDSRWHAAMAKLTGGLSPVALTLAWTDWALHLATQPAQARRLGLAAWGQGLRLLGQSLAPAAQDPADPATPADPRFADPLWARWPWQGAVQAAQAAETWWAEATQLRGMSPHHQEMAGFFARQWLDMLSPANWGLANPEVLRRTLERQGGNLRDGAAHLGDDWRRRHGLSPLQPPTRPYQPGVDLAVTPGRVVHRNALAELIQYDPVTPQVQAEPVFLVPSWIMKYYILDLSPENSLVRWLVGQGHTVFILSWRNPDEGDARLTLADYLEAGIFDALAAIGRAVPGEAVHACGYCLGGTLLSIGAAALARPGQVQGAQTLPPLASLSLLAAETDFTEPGELGVLIDEGQVALLEDMMAERGYLSGAQMAGSFAYLHSRDLVWSQQLRRFWMGEADQPNDLMAWNADTTRMPALMHSEYLRRCYLRNELAEGRFPVEGRPVSLGDLRQPLFVVGTEKDHVSPWKSVYKLHRLTDTDLTFVLANGGHNAGIVSEPGHRGRHYALRLRPAGAAWVPPEAWGQQAERREGSWWQAWHDWLVTHSRGPVTARTPAAGLGPAPGHYVLQRYVEAG